MKPKEFFKRWKGGIQQITPLQQQKINLIGSVFVVCGVIIGIITSFIIKLWWMLVILLGSLLLTGVSLISILQKYFVFNELNKQMKEQDDDNKNIDGE